MSWLVPVIFRLSGGAAACDYDACALAERAVADPLHRRWIDAEPLGNEPRMPGPGRDGAGSFMDKHERRSRVALLGFVPRKS